MTTDQEFAEWVTLLAAPATRGELIQAMTMIHTALLSHSLFFAAILDGNEKLQRRVAEQSLDAAGLIPAELRRMVDEWRATDG